MLNTLTNVCEVPLCLPGSERHSLHLVKIVRLGSDQPLADKWKNFLCFD
jgi:hypothetical protein